MKIKTNELNGAALDWAVAKCDNILDDLQISAEFGAYWTDEDGVEIVYSPSTDWAQGGPIIELEKIELLLYADGWRAEMGSILEDGATPLIAAMRCYVASKLGDEVDIKYNEEVSGRISED
jgi:hypothetical protein